VLDQAFASMAGLTRPFLAENNLSVFSVQVGIRRAAAGQTVNNNVMHDVVVL